MRVAVLDHEDRPGSPARTLACALDAARHHAEVVRGRSLPDAPLRLRKIGDRPGRLPGAVLGLARGRFDVAHAFTPQDAVAAVLWSRATGRPAVVTVCEPLERARLADRRLRLATLRLGLERPAAVIAPNAEVAESLRRWMGLEPHVIAAADSTAHLKLYDALAGR